MDQELEPVDTPLVAHVETAADIDIDEDVRVESPPSLDIIPLPTLAFAYSGVITLLAWNLLLSTTDHWNHRLGEKFAAYSAAAYSTSQVVGQTAMVAFPIVPSFHEFVTSLIVMGGLLFMVPVCDAVLPAGNALVASLFCIFLLGIANSVYQCAGFGLCSNLPGLVVVYYSTGQGIAGILTAVISLFGEGDTSIWVNFSVCSFLIVGSGLQYWYFRRHPMVKHLLTSREVDTPLRGNEEERRPARESFRDAASMAVGVFSCFLATFLVLPSVAPHWKMASDAGVSRVIALFQVFDVAGRFAPNFFEFAARYVRCMRCLLVESHLCILTLVFLRFLFVPLFICIQRYPDAFQSDAWKYISMTIFAFSNGWTCSLCMVQAPLQVHTLYEKNRVGAFMSFSLIFGLFCGSMLGLLTQIGI